MLNFRHSASKLMDMPNLVTLSPAEQVGPDLAQALIDLSAEGLLLLQEDGAVRMANARATALLQCEHAALCGGQFWDAVSDDVAEKHEAEAARALKAGREYTFLDLQKFEARWLEYTMKRTDMGVVIQVRNVTERHRLMGLLRENERRSQELFEANPNVMWVCDADSLRILAVNGAAVAFYDHPRDEFLSLSALRLYADDSDTDLRESLPGLVPGSPARLQQRLCRHKKKDGRVLVVEVSGRPVEWNGARALLVTVANVTGRHVSDSALRNEKTELEARLKDRTRELEEAYQELGAVTYAMSHDLQSPLHAVDGFAKTLSSQFAEALGEQGTHYLRRINASVSQMSRLIDDLRLLSRLSRMPMNVQDIDLAPICLSIIERLRQAEPGRYVELEIDPALHVRGDRGLLTTAMMALIGNAWKFTSKKPQGWIRVGMADVVAQQPGEQVVYVSDNGAGFDSQYAHKLFANFQRLHSSADFPGAGLGLAIVRRIAERHAGRVWAESINLAGATFYLGLPGSGSAENR